MRVCACCLVCIVAACAPTSPPPPNQAPLVWAFANADTEQLWTAQAATPDPLELMLVEAELGSRGQLESDGRYLGSRTISSVGASPYARSEPSSGDQDCSDFPSAASAQRFFLSAGGPAYDPYGLDRDGDGNACEWGTKLREISYAQAVRPAPTLQTVISADSACHVGPRGGTYTITASGNKNYDGC